jgi:Protein of unknown function (DUF4012)
MSEGEPRRWRARRVVWVLVVALVLGAAGAAIVGVATLGLTADLEGGRRALESGRRALMAGEVADATAAFEEARRAFAGATTEAGSGLGPIAGGVPLLGRTFDVAAALADAGRHAAGAGLTISGGIERLPGGVEALAPTKGALPTEAFASLADSLAEARSEAARAVELVRSSPGSWVVGPVEDARRRALDGIEEIEGLLGSARALARGLPAFAGVGEPRRYLFMAENPAELRGTGGLWGAYSVVRVSGGRFEFSSFRPVQSLGNVSPDAVPAPNPDYRRNYDQWGGAGYWLNVNMTPDFPSAARAALSLWEARGGKPLDGVLTADPFALRDLLSVTGAVRIPRPALTVNFDNVVPILSNRAFALFPSSQIRKAVLGEVARVIFGRFLALDGRAIPRIRAIGRAVAEGHLKIYAAEGGFQEDLVAAGLDRGLPPPEGPQTDLLGVVVNSGSGGKVDFFSKRTVRHEVTLLPAGSRATTVTSIENGAPTSGQPRYVIGPHVGNAGDNIPLVAVFCGERCRLTGAERDGRRTSVFAGSELGYPFYRDYFTIPSGDTAVYEVRTETPGSWTGDAFRGSYRLVILGQTTIRPTDARVRIRAPEGMSFTGWSDGIRVNGDVATWEGTLGNGVTLELTFEAPSLPVRLWRVLTPF